MSKPPAKPKPQRSKAADNIPISTASMREPLTPQRHVSLRPGAEDYRQHPSIINGIRRPYRRPSHIERTIP
jgi:hypothetical protein